MDKIQHSQPNAIGSLLAVFLLTVPTIAEDFPPDHTTTAVHCQATQPVGTPIVITLILTNTGDKPLFYVSDKPYPNAAQFVAQVCDAQGRVKEVTISNRQGAKRSGPLKRIEPRESVQIPALIDPLPPGSYSIQIGKGKSAHLTVKDDPELARQWEQELLVKVRKGDEFGRFVANKHLSGKFVRKSLIEALFQDSLSDDDHVAEGAASLLAVLRELPANSTAMITKGIKKHIGIAKQRGRGQTLILNIFAGLAAKIGTDEALEPVLTLARTELTRGAAVAALGKFKQEKAAQQLRSFLQDPNDEIQFRAAQGLADRKDPAALEVLLAVAHNPKSRWRYYAFDALLKFPDDKRVEPAIRSGLDDPDRFVREGAESALRDLHRVKKP